MMVKHGEPPLFPHYFPMNSLWIPYWWSTKIQLFGLFDGFFEVDVNVLNEAVLVPQAIDLGSKKELLW